MVKIETCRHLRCLRTEGRPLAEDSSST
jgi:hypothetical protein